MLCCFSSPISIIYTTIDLLIIGVSIEKEEMKNNKENGSEEAIAVYQ